MYIAINIIYFDLPINCIVCICDLSNGLDFFEHISNSLIDRLFYKNLADRTDKSIKNIQYISNLQVTSRFVCKGHWILQNGLIDGSPISLVRTHHTLIHSLFETDI